MEARTIRVLRLAGWAGLALLLLLFGAFVWPTLYRWDHMGMAQGWSYPVRINRITGQAEMLLPSDGTVNSGGWRRLGHPPRGRASRFEDLLH